MMRNDGVWLIIRELGVGEVRVFGLVRAVTGM